jgi:hypothetical protein
VATSKISLSTASSAEDMAKSIPFIENFILTAHFQRTNKIILSFIIYNIL